MNKFPEVINLTKLSEYLDIKRRTLYMMIDDGRFDVKPIKGTNPRLWNRAEVDAWKAARV